MTVPGNRAGRPGSARPARAETLPVPKCDPEAPGIPGVPRGWPVRCQGLRLRPADAAAGCPGDGLEWPRSGAPPRPGKTARGGTTPQPCRPERHGRAKPRFAPLVVTIAAPRRSGRGRPSAVRPPGGRHDGNLAANSDKRWCRVRDLNPRPTAYKAVALPAELTRPAGFRRGTRQAGPWTAMTGAGRR